MLNKLDSLVEKAKLGNGRWNLIANNRRAFVGVYMRASGNSYRRCMAESESITEPDYFVRVECLRPAGHNDDGLSSQTGWVVMGDNDSICIAKVFPQAELSEAERYATLSGLL